VWNDPLALNRLTRILVMAAFAFCAYTMVKWVAARPLFAIRALTVEAPDGAALDHVTGQQVAKACLPRLTGTFFTADLEDARGAFEALPWVRHASVRRQWPDRLVVVLEEHRALARWNDEAGNRFVNLNGEAFNAPGEAKTGAALPLLSGPDGSEKDVARRYGEVRDLFGRIGKTPAEVALSPRQAWTIKLADGLAIEVGREQPQASVSARLERFVAHYGATVGRIARVDTVDLRYPNGFAVRVPGLHAPAVPAERPAAAPGENKGTKPRRTQTTRRGGVTGESA
jgi:cell division protein FtsQ